MEIFLSVLRVLAAIVIAFGVGKLVTLIKLPAILGWLIAGMALGMRGTFPSGLFYDTFISRALYKPDGFHTKTWAGGFTLGCQF